MTDSNNLVYAAKRGEVVAYKLDIEDADFFIVKDKDGYPDHVLKSEQYPPSNGECAKFCSLVAGTDLNAVKQHAVEQIDAQEKHEKSRIEILRNNLSGATQEKFAEEFAS